MAISFETALGIHADAFKFRAQRAEIIANNLANSDTPNFKARDLDFQQVFADAVAEGGTNLVMTATHAGHNRHGSLPVPDGNLSYRVPIQPSIDGNTVDEHVEHAEFMQNALGFQSSFTFLNSRFKGLISAIRGE